MAKKNEDKQNLSQEQKIRKILKVWKDSLKDENTINELYWELDLFLLVDSLLENIDRLKDKPEENLNYDLKILIRELHHQLRIDENKFLINKANPQLSAYLRRLYWFDGSRLEFKRNDKDYSKNKHCNFTKSGCYSPKNIFSRLEKYLLEIKEILNAKNIAKILILEDLTSEQVILYTKYYIQSLIFDYKQSKRTLAKLLGRSLISEVFKTIEDPISNHLTKVSKEILEQSQEFINSALTEIRTEKGLSYKDFVSKIQSGQSTQQKDYTYNIYGFIDSLGKNTIKSPKDTFEKNLVELFFRNLIYSHVSKRYHSNDPLDESKDSDKAYKGILDTVFRAILSDVNFLKDFVITTDPNDLPESILVNFKEPITQEFLARKSLHTKLRNDLWYKLIISFSKSVKVHKELLSELKSPKYVEQIKKDQLKKEDIVFTDFDQLNNLVKLIEDDFSFSLKKLRNKELIDSNHQDVFSDLNNYVLQSLNRGYYDTFISNINFDDFSKNNFDQILLNSLRSQIPKIQKYRVITSLSHIDLDGEIKKIDDECYIYDSRKWDTGENNNLDFFRPSNFLGEHKDYTDIKYASPFYFMASHTGWGQSTNPEGKMVRHSIRVVNTVNSYGVDGAIHETRIKVEKIKNILVTPWAYYTNTRQSANILGSNQYSVVNKNYTEYHFVDLNKAETINESKLSLKSAPYKNFQEVYVSLVKSTNPVDNNVLESLSYWHDAMWEARPEKKFFILIKALSGVLGADPTSHKGEKRYLDIIASTTNSRYWRKFLYDDVVLLWKEIDTNKKMKRAYQKLVKKSSYYLDLVKIINKIRTDKDFSPIKEKIEDFHKSYDNDLLVGNTRYLRGSKQVELVILRTKRHSILHHDNADAFDSYNVNQYNWKLEKVYRGLYMEILQSRRNGANDYEEIVQNLNL